jgi:hypothetical protein
MKTHQNHHAYYGKSFFKGSVRMLAEILSNVFGKSTNRSMLVALLICHLLFALYGCGKPDDNPIPDPVNPTGCVITSDVDQSLGSRLFEYDDKGYLTKMTGPNYYYGLFVETIASNKVVDTYPTRSVTGNGTHLNGIINTTYTYSGGSGNLYDGNPEIMHQLFTASNPQYSIKRDTLFQFKYQDAKKHLTTVAMPGNGFQDSEGYTLFRVELNFTYDDNDNVSQVKIIYNYYQVTKQPGESHTYVKQVSDELLNITYDNKPSPYSAISKYWKFAGGDFLGFDAYNLDKLRYWAGRCAILSKNNPVKITGKLRQAFGTPLMGINANLTYEYNEKNFPVIMAINGSGVNAFTYKCK